jgi:hypothetical protein
LSESFYLSIEIKDFPDFYFAPSTSLLGTVTMAAEEPEFHDFYKYTPSKVAAAVFIVLFAISSVVHLLQLLRHRVWFFIPMFIGGLC